MKFTFPPESKPLAGYTIKRGIHRGAFGEVYYAHTDAGKEVALKLLQSQFEVELRGVRQCLNLKHPNLVGLYDIRVDDDGDHWIVMEYVAGRSLADVLEDHPDGLPPDEVERWVTGMAAGLDFLHDRGIVHRDLKPANVFIEDGVVKIGDVGLSKYISQSRRNEQTQSVGTVYYMAPEVAHGRYGQEVDVYSLGIVLYELLTGRVPFEGESTGEILMKHLAEEPDLTVVDGAFRPPLAKALAKDPMERTHTAGELARAFSAARPRTVARELIGAAVATPSSSPSLLDRPSFGTPTIAPPTRPPDDEERRADVTQPDTGGETPNRWHGPFLGWDPRTWFRDGSTADGEGNRFLRAWHGPHARWVRWGTAAGVVALFASGIGFVLLAFALVVAAVKFGIEKLVDWYGGGRAAESTEPSTEVVEESTPSPVVQPVRLAKTGELLMPDTPRVLGWRQRMAELTASLAYATPLTALVTFCIVVATPWLTGASPGLGHADPAVVGLFAGVTLLGSWAILTTAKFAEGRELKGLHRRLVFFAVGSVVGAAAYWLQTELFVTLGDRLMIHPRDSLVNEFNRHRLYDPARVPMLHSSAYVMYFGLLFAARRWWWHVDGFRPERFRVWTVLVTGFVGGLLPIVVSFWDLWGALWAVAISCVVQLAAPWMPPEDRYLGGRAYDVRHR